MSNETISPFGVNIVQDNELAFLIESRLLKFKGTWRLHESTIGEVDQQLLNLLNYDYLLNIDNHNQLVHPQDIPLLIKQLKEGARNSTCDIRIRLIHSDGSIRKFDGHGQILEPGIVETDTDVAEMELSLELELKLLQNTEATNETGSWKWDIENNNIFFAENVYMILGISVSQTIRSWEDFLKHVHKNDRHKLGELMSVIKESGKVTTIDFRIEKPDKSLRYLRAKAEIFETKSGRKYCIGAVRDRTTEVLTETKLKEADLLLTKLQRDVKMTTASEESLSESGLIKKDIPESSLQDSNELLSRVINASNNRTVLFEAIRNEDGEITDFLFRLVSSAATAFYGGSNYAGRTFKEMFPDAFAEQFGRMCEVVKTGTQKTFEEFVNGNEASSWYQVTDAKSADGIVRVWKDIAPRKVIEQELRKSKELLESVIQSDIVALGVLKPVYDNEDIIDFEWVIANRLQRAMGSGQKLVGQRYTKVFPAVIKNGNFHLLRKAFRSGERVTNDFYYQDKNIKGWFRGAYVKMNDLLIVSAEDITSIKNEEEKLRREHYLLKEAQGIGHIGSFEWRSGQDSILWSDEMYRIHGLQPSAGPITFEKDYSFIHQDDASWCIDLLEKSRRRPMKINIVHRAILKNGDVRYFNRRFESFADDNAKFIYAHGTIQDVTETRMAEEERIKNLRLLQQAEEVTELGSWEFFTSNGRFHCSEGMYGIFDLRDDQEVTPEIFFDYALGEDCVQAQRIVNLIKNDQRSFEERIRILVNKKERTIIIKASVLRDPQAEVVKVLGIVIDITDIVESERAVQEQGHFINRVVETIPDMLTVMTLPDRRIEYANREPFSDQGFTKEMLDNDVEKRKELIHADDRESVNSFFDRFDSMDDEVVNSVEYRARNISGEWQWFKARGKVFKRDQAGHVTHCVNVVQNINLQKMAEERIMDQNHYIQRLVDTVPDTIFIYDLDFEQLVYSNPEVFQLLGYLPEELLMLDENVFDVCLHADDLLVLKKVFHDFTMAQDNEVVENTFRMIHKDGSIRTVQMRLTPFKRGRSKKVTQLVVIFRDISALKIAEDDNVRMKDILTQKAEDRYRQLFNSIDEGLCIIEILFEEDQNPVDYRFLETNPAFEKLTDLKDVAGKTMRELMKGEENWLKIYGDVARSGQSMRFVKQVQELNNRWYEVFAFPTGEAGGNRVAILFSDISERINSEQQLRQLNEKLRESDKAKTDFFNNVSHEFRTPLTLLLGPLDDILRNANDKLANRNDIEKLQLAYRNALRLQKLVNNMLDFSRIQAGGMDFVFQLTDIAKYTKDLASNFRSAIEKAGLKFSVVTEKINEPVYVDRSMWERIVFNLLSNALKYTEKGEIRVVLQKKENVVELEVADTGIGISPDNIPMIFQRFRRGERSTLRASEGSGIGLALVQELAKIHGGIVNVNSTESTGSSFIVRIPTGKEHLPKDNISEKTDSHSLSESEYLDEGKAYLTSSKVSDDKRVFRGREKMPLVVLADDNGDMREYIRSLLVEQYDVMAVENGIKVMEILKNGRVPDLILSDVMMPGMDGFELLNVIKSSDQWSRIPVILISARAGEESRIEGMEFGADDYLIKPFTARELQARVNARIEIALLRNQREDLLKEVNKQLELQVFERTKELLSNRDELKLQKELLQRCMDAMPQLVWTADPLGNFSSFNDRWYAYTGISHQNAQGGDYLKSGVIHPSHLKEVQAKWQFAINEGLPYSNETLIRGKDGEYRWHLDLGTPIKNESGEIFMWVGTLTDVHEQFVAEKNVEEHKNLLEAILNSSQNGIQVLDCIRDENDFRIIDFEWKYFNSIVKENVFGTDLHNKRLTVEYKESLSDGLFNNLKDVMLKGDPMEFEYNFKRDDDEWCFNVTAVKLEDSVVVTLHDITSRVKGERELKFLNASLQQKNIELESMNEQLSTFAFVASHDLREPLRKIHFFVNSIRQDNGVRLSVKSKGYFDKIITAVQRMNSMISDILKFSRANGNNESFSEIDLNKVLLLATNDLSEAIKEKEAVVSNNLLPKLRGNQTQLIQLFENLMSNGIKFQKTGVRPEVNINAKMFRGRYIDHPHADPDKKYVCIEFSDNGIGFDEQYLPKIFQMFQRLHGISEYPGTGMGLAICKKIVENHGGFMWAKSKPGEGSTFSCCFPIS